MLGFLRRHLHRRVRRNIHQAWMQWSIRLYEGVTTFVHGLLWFTGFLFLSGHIAAGAVQAGYHFSRVWSNADKIVALDLGQMGWQGLLALASIPSGLMALYSMFTAYERWRVWAHHGHHCDAALIAPDLPEIRSRGDVGAENA
jgi:hypothetical protein